MQGNILVDIVMPDRQTGVRIKPVIPSYGLSLLKAMMPDWVTARVHDERTMGVYDVSKWQPDILCLSYLTTGANRAHRISQQARDCNSRNSAPIKIAHGGIHATSLPLEAIEYADGVLQGETNAPFLDVFLRHIWESKPGEKVITRMRNIPGTIEHPVVDRSWTNPKDYIIPWTIQSSVGCPFGCHFCSVTAVSGRNMRARELTCLAADIASLPRGVVAIIDDNFLWGSAQRYVDHCRMVADLLRRSGHKWVAEVTPRTLIEAQARLKREGSSYDILADWAEKRCGGLFFGLETVGEDKAGLSKVKDQAETLELIKKCQDLGIMVLGAFVLGVGQNETTDHAKRILEFAIKAKLDYAQFAFNTPEPGADGFLTYFRAGWFINSNWDDYDANHVVIKHPGWTPETGETALDMCYKEFYSWCGMKARFLSDPLAALLNPSALRRIAQSFAINAPIALTNARKPGRPVRPATECRFSDAVIKHVQAIPEKGHLFDVREPNDGISVFLD